MLSLTIGPYQPRSNISRHLSLRQVCKGYGVCLGQTKKAAASCATETEELCDETFTSRLSTISGIFRFEDASVERGATNLDTVILA